MLRMEGSCNYTGHAVADNRQEMFFQSGEWGTTAKKQSCCLIWDDLSTDALARSNQQNRGMQLATVSHREDSLNLV